MKVQKTLPIACNKSGVSSGAAPFTMTARRRIFGLDIGDWSMVLISLTLVGLLLTLV